MVRRWRVLSFRVTRHLPQVLNPQYSWSLLQLEHFTFPVATTLAVVATTVG